MNVYVFVSFTDIDIRYIKFNLGDVDNLSIHFPLILQENQRTAGETITG